MLRITGVELQRAMVHLEVSRAGCGRWSNSDLQQALDRPRHGPGADPCRSSHQHRDGGRCGDRAEARPHLRLRLKQNSKWRSPSARQPPRFASLARLLPQPPPRTAGNRLRRSRTTVCCSSLPPNAAPVRTSARRRASQRATRPPSPLRSPRASRPRSPPSPARCPMAAVGRSQGRDGRRARAAQARCLDRRRGDRGVEGVPAPARPHRRRHRGRPARQAGAVRRRRHRCC